MKRFLCIALMLMAVLSCRREPYSYEGLWNYDCSEPDLGEAYRGSWLYVEKGWDFTWWDASTGQKFTGNGNSMQREEGFIVTVTSRNKSENRVYTVEIKRLKDGVMEVITDSLNGVETRIRLVRE